MAHTAFTLAGVAALLAAAQLAAYEFPLPPRSLTDAITVSRSGIAARRTFHRGYRREVNQAPVDYIEVITPFRRVELAAEERDRLGRGLLSQREAIAVAGEGGGVLELQIELTFHPLNTFIGVPNLGVAIAETSGTGAIVEPRSIQRIPRFGPRADSAPTPRLFQSGPPAAPGGEPLTGGTIVAIFDAERLAGSKTADVLLSEEGQPLVKVAVGLATVR